MDSAKIEKLHLHKKSDTPDFSSNENDTEDTDEITALIPSSIIRIWKGTFDSNNPASLEVNKIEGTTFYGILNVQGFRIAFIGL